MARDNYDESKPKKKKETQKPKKVEQSPSPSNVKDRAKKSTFLGGGSPVQKVEQKATRTVTPTRQTTTTTPKRTTMTDAQYQKTYGQPRRTSTQRTQTVKREPITSKTTNQRLTAAQRQKMGLNDQLTASDRERWKKDLKERQEKARIKKMGLAPEDQPTAAQREAANRALKNTPELVKKAGKDAASGYLQTLNDITERAAKNENGVKAQAMKMGIEENTKQYQQLEENRKKTAEKARQDNDSLYQKMQDRQAKWDEKTKDAKGFEKAYYGAVESGTGMIADAAIGGLTGTGQVGALASMGLRTYGSSANQARAEGATDAEAGWYGLGQAVKEMGTEMIGGGGLAKAAYGKGALGLGDIATNTLIRNLKGQTADLAHMGIRLVGDVAEENIEEAAGWALDPWIKELTYGKNVRAREAQSAMKERSDALRSEITNEDDARAAAAYLSSDDFIEQTKQQYIAAGLKEKDAEEVAERMRDYLTASLTGDTDSMEKIEDEVSKKVAKSHNVLKDYNFKELKETFEATSLLVGATGLPANIKTADIGNITKQQLGDEGVRALANTAIDFEDGNMSLKAKAMKERIDSGKELTSTQVYELQAGMQEQVRKDTERQTSSRRMAARAIQNDNLLTPYRENQNGGIDLDEVTEAAYRENANKAGAIIDALSKENKESITDTEKIDGSKAIAGFQTGVFTVDDANALNYSNTAIRSAFETATGIDLGQYVVKNKNGEVDIPATNTKTKDALFAMAADNLVKSAQAETKNWMDNAKGQVVTQVSARMGAQGSAALQQALDDVDERDRSKYMMTTNAADMMYQAARNMGTEWSDVASEATKMFPGIDPKKLEQMYNAGLQDRRIANSDAHGRQVKMGEALSQMGDKETSTGKVFIDSEVPPKGTVIRTFTEIAKNLGADIHFVDFVFDKNGDVIEGANGSYDPNTNTFYLNVTTGIEQNVGYIFMHEMTHYLKKFAPEQYQALENFVREKWFAYNPSQMQDAIARKIEAYKRVTKGQQVLTEEQALEEIIADASHEFINDPEFAKQVAEEDMGLAKAVLDSIRNALRMLRRIFASGSIDDDTHMNALFSELDILKEAETLWLNAYKAAVKNSATAAINQWQENANEQSSLSVSEGFTIQDGTARWTDERIDDLIERYGASNPDYSQAYAVLMNPRDFLHITIEDELLRKWRESAASQPEGLTYKEGQRAVWDKSYLEGRLLDDQNFPLDEAELRGQAQTPFLYIRSNKSGQRVLGHEGRHRMRALMEAGVTSVPVVIEDPDTKTSKQNVDSMILGYQEDVYNGAGIVEVNDLVPIKESNRDELIQKFGGEAQVRFSMSEPVERVKDLIAVHNLNEEDLVGDLSLGGFPMPSIAITKDSMGHEKYGDISLLFHSDTIDPTVTNANQVFGGDAYTPTFPTVHYKANSKVSKKLVDMYYGNSNTLGYDAMRPMYEYAVTIDDTLDRVGGEAKLIERAKKDTALMRLYLRMNDKDIETITKSTTTSLSDAEVERNDFWINELGKDAILEARPSDLKGREAMQHFVNWRDERLDELKKTYEKLCREVYGFDDADIKEVMADEKTVKKEISSNIVAASLYLKNGRDTTKTEIDYDATNKLVEETAKANSYDAWVEDLFKGIEEKSGIRNDKDWYTPAGNRRSWESLHEPVTLDNVVRQMKKELDSGGGTFLGNNPVGAAQKKYKSLDDIRADEDRLQYLDDENYGNLREQATVKLSKVSHEIYDNSPKRQNSYAMFGAIDVGSDIAEALNKTRNKDKLKKILKRDYSYNVSEQNMDDLMDALHDLANLPTEYFEAKPKRAVRFDEVKAAIVPEGFAGHLKAQLSIYGTKVYEYDPETEGDRTEKVNQAASENDLRFSITPEMDEAYMDAVNSGNMEEAQRLVNKAASVAGYGTRLYHGTRTFGFTQIRTSELESKSDGGYYDWSPFFASDSLEVAQTYSSEDDVKRISEANEPFDEDTFDDEYHDSVDSLINSINEFAGIYNYMDYSVNPFLSAYKELQTTSHPVNDITEELIDNVTDIISEIAWSRAVDYVEAHPEENISEDAYADELQESIETNSIWVNVDIVNDMLRAYDEGMYGSSSSGNYELLTNTDNMMTVDAKGHRWNDIPFDEIPEKRGYYRTRQLAEIARDEGYDGIQISNLFDDGGHGKGKRQKNPATIYIFFKPERQVKSADTVTYAEDGSVIPLSERFDPNNNDIRYSLPTQDSDGNILTDGQMEYFKNSQARDDQGRLVPVYHGTQNGGFTIFDSRYGISSRYFFFVDSMSAAKGYSGSEEMFSESVAGEEDMRLNYKVYLDMVNPLIVDAQDNSWVHIPYEDDFVTTNWLAEYAESEGYDGVIVKNVIDRGSADTEYAPQTDYIVFSSNQIKDTQNQNPTENPDIRYSFTPEDEAMSQIAYDDAMDTSYELLAYYEQQIGNVDPETYDVTRMFSEEEDMDRLLDALKAEDSVPSSDAMFEEDRVRRARSKEDFYNNVNAKWNDRWITEGEVLKISSVKKDITNLVKGAMANSNSDAQYRNEIVRKTLIDARTAYQLMKQDQTGLASYLLYHSAKRMVEGLEFIRDDTAFTEYKEIRDFLRRYRINAPEEYWHNEKFHDFRKEYYGRLRIGKGNSNIEDVYQDCQDRWPHLFNESEREKAGLGDAVEDLLQHIGVVVDSNVTPFMEAYSSEEATSLIYDLADQLYEIIANGDRVVSLADSYKEKFDAKTKAMKQRHYEAILRERKIREEGIRKERQKFREYKEAQKERKAHTEYFNKIKGKYDELTKRLLTNTKDKHIPEQYKRELAGLLKAFDFQTVGSKKREAKTGYKAKNTIKLEAMRTALEGIEANSQLFHINDSVTDLMKDLLGLNEASANKESIEGKTLDELSASELKKVYDLLSSLLHEFNNYEKVKVGIKKQQAADIGHAQNNISLEHALLFGAGRDYQNTPGWIDKILNLDEMTPAYMFKRIDPNNEGLGLMWKEIRRSFDKYVRNQNQLNDWMEEIVGKYHNKGVLWNKYGSGELTNWRSDNYAHNFKLESGHTIRLTIAQIMSVACLANRKQAYDHMIGNGVVVSPVTFNAKMLSDLKKKVNKALPERLTDSDIKNIVAALTPEQRQVANKLQELMATKMAEWGNEASMNVIGIRLFEDPDYFPIRSDRGGLTKDLDPNQFEQAIRNFGFTKAVQPGAKNAIMIDDIFDVVTEHCNNMNLYNSYTEAMNDFMKVYNYREAREEGEYTVEQALSHAFSSKAPTFIMQFMRDLNGNVSKRASGIEDAYNSLLGNAKKAAVFANLRVAAQQPTAITRAFAVINPKYLKGIRIGQGDMKEMFEHCPIALWKSWGYYDINMGKSIEDIMMNNGKWLEDKATDLYGALDNVTWTAIWQMVKAEMKDTHPNVKVGTDEYWELCNERMSEIVDLSQVVDSPMHRSHAMRDKGFLKKTATAFMAEPTLTFNMIRDGWIGTKEAWQNGDRKKATAIAARTSSVALLQAATVAGAAAIVDALRKKNPDKDDDEDKFLHLWWVNCLENFKNELELWNKIYFIKDIASVFEGWDNVNLALQGIQKFALGYRQLSGDPYARSSAEWYENMADGIGYMWGIPVKTVRTGLSNAMKALGLSSPFLDTVGENLSSLAGDKSSSDTDKSGFIGSLISDESSGMFGKLLTTSTKAETEETEESTEDGSVPTKESLPDNLSDEQKNEIIKSAEKRAKKAKPAEEQQQLDYDTMLYDALKAASGLEGEEYNKKVYSSVANGLKGYIADGDYTSVGMMRTVIEQAGGDVDYFDKRVLEETRTAYKKSLVFDPSLEERNNMKAMYRYMMSHGMTQEELSSEILYKSDLAKDMKVAYRVGDNDMIYETMTTLVDAGITQTELDKLWENRNRMNIEKYKENGRYKDALKSTGNFIWPTDGQITSYFGYRNAPTAGASSNHPAIDIGAPMGSDVVAADGGVVIYVGNNGGYGKSVGIKHDNGMVTYYNHLSAWNVHEGDTVAQGQQIANVGSTGVSTGPHLDFKVLDANGEPVDPLKYLASRS